MAILMFRYHLTADEVLDGYTFKQAQVMLATSEREERQRLAALIQAIHTADPQKLHSVLVAADKPATKAPTTASPRATWAAGVQRLAGLTVQDQAERQRIQQQVSLYDRAARLLESRKANG